MKIEDIRKRLQAGKAQTVRRILPGDFIRAHMLQYFHHMEAMMGSFQATLTFPTMGREYPRLAMEKIRQQVCGDLKNSEEKILAEVDDLLKAVRAGKVMQSYIMLNLVGSTPFPFCLLNTLDYRAQAGKRLVPCYVILWARQVDREQPVQVWSQLAPINQGDWDKLPAAWRNIQFDKLKTESQLVRVPMGQVEFYGFNTAVSVILHDVPSEEEALLSGKSIKELLKELKILRESLLRRKEQRGKFLHIVWAEQIQPDYVPLSEDKLFGGAR
jgi:hypothetical protein